MRLINAACASALWFLFSPSLVQGQTFAETRTGDFHVQLDTLRSSVERDFAGFGQFDDASELALDDRLPEQTVVQACRSVPEVLKAARDVWPRFALQEFSVSRQFPRNAVYFRRTSESTKTRDILNFYFVIEKRVGLECAFTFGAFARTIVSKTGSAAAKNSAAFDELVADIQLGIKEIAATLAADRKGVLFDRGAPTAVSSEAERAMNTLQSMRYRDDIVDEAVARALAFLRAELAGYQVTRDDITVLVVKFASQVPAELERYRTSSCVAVPRDFATPTILCSADYLSEVEAALRFFENADLSIRRTSSFRRLTADFGQDATSMLARLRANRRISEMPGQDRDHVTEHLTMAAVFLLSHEIGHFLSDDGIAAIDDSAFSVTATYRAAILRLCQHADEFTRAGFNLPGFDAIIDPSSANRSFIDKFRQEDRLIGLTDDLFKGESLADSFGIDLSLRYFASTSRIDPAAAEMQQYLFLENMEALATYFWYKSYFQFTDTYCDTVRTSAELQLCLGLRPENFVAAADVFGRYHRNLFLRAHEMFGVFVSERTTFYDIPMEDRRLATYQGDETFEALDAGKREAAFRLMSALQRRLLLTQLVDTPLKFAFTGCTLGWAREIRGGTVPLMFMQFFSYEEELERFKEALSGR